MVSVFHFVSYHVAKLDFFFFQSKIQMHNISIMCVAMMFVHCFWLVPSGPWVLSAVAFTTSWKCAVAHWSSQASRLKVLKVKGNFILCLLHLPSNSRDISVIPRKENTKTQRLRNADNFFSVTTCAYVQIIAWNLLFFCNQHEVSRCLTQTVNLLSEIGKLICWTKLGISNIQTVESRKKKCGGLNDTDGIKLSVFSGVRAVKKSMLTITIQKSLAQGKNGLNCEVTEVTRLEFQVYRACWHWPDAMSFSPDLKLCYFIRITL